MNNIEEIKYSDHRTGVKCTVTWNKTTNEIKCDCTTFSFTGHCSHISKVKKDKGIP
jgi:hypothetical protein